MWLFEETHNYSGHFCNELRQDMTSDFKSSGPWIMVSQFDDLLDDYKPFQPDLIPENIAESRTTWAFS
jgi:hypothetical protein